MKISRLLVLILAMTASAVLVACGGDDDSSSDAPTKADFIVQADDICTSGDEEVNQAATEEFGTEQPTEEAALAFTEDTVIPNIEQQLSDLRDLTPPEGDEDTFNELLDALDEGVATIKEDPSSDFGGENPLAEANTLAQDYGFTSCGSEA